MTFGAGPSQDPTSEGSKGDGGRRGLLRIMPPPSALEFLL